MLQILLTLVQTQFPLLIAAPFELDLFNEFDRPGELSSSPVIVSDIIKETTRARFDEETS